MFCKLKYKEILLTFKIIKITHKNSIRDVRTPQLGEVVFNTMKYRGSEIVQRLGYKILKVEVSTVRSKS